jgi:hypothetical protein
VLLVSNRDQFRDQSDVQIEFEDFYAVVKGDRHAAQDLFDKIDTNHSGDISTAELLEYCTGTFSSQKISTDSFDKPQAPKGKWTYYTQKFKMSEEADEKLSFLAKEFEGEYCWFEVVEYTKKLMMTGVLMKAEQGSSTQIFFGLLISFVYFALVVRTMPYRSIRTDIIRVAGELQLFFTMLCTLMLRLDLHEEFMTRERVSTLLIVVNFVMTPIPFGIDIFIRIRDFLRDGRQLLVVLKGAGLKNEGWMQQIFRADTAKHIGELTKDMGELLDRIYVDVEDTGEGSQLGAIDAVQIIEDDTNAALEDTGTDGEHTHRKVYNPLMEVEQPGLTVEPQPKPSPPLPSSRPHQLQQGNFEI